MDRRIGSALLRWIVVAALGCGAVVWGQETAPTPPTVEVALRQMSDVAGVVFTGEVTAVRHRAGENGASGVVEIDFRVEDAVRGCTAGGTYTLREWAGLWSGGVERYRVGQRRLMLLHAPRAAGVSSPVGGMDGSIPIRGTSQAPGMVSASTAATAEIADLRWVGTRVMRRAPPTSSTVVTAASDGATAANTPGDASIASQQAPVSVVVGMLRSWQQDAR